MKSMQCNRVKSNNFNYLSSNIEQTLTVSQVFVCWAQFASQNFFYFIQAVTNPLASFKATKTYCKFIYSLFTNHLHNSSYMFPAIVLYI